MKKQIIKNQQPAGVFELRYGQDRKKSTPIVVETPLKSRRDNTPVSQDLPVIEVETKPLDQILPSFQVKKEIKKGIDRDSIRAEQQALWDAGAFKGIKNKYGKELSYKEAVDGLEGKLTKQARTNYQSTSRDWIPVGRDKKTLRDEQEALWNAGAFKGLKNRSGREVSYQEAVDGIEGSMTRQARENYRKTIDAKLPADPLGFIPVRERRRMEENAQARKEGIAKQRELAPRRKFTTNLGNESRKNGLAKMYEMTHAAQTGGMNSIPINQQQENPIDNEGHAIYLHYPNFIGQSKNAIKIGNYDLANIIDNPELPVGHAATILIDKEGRANYYEYGRYTPRDGHIIGKEQRPTVKGGNWRRIQLPSQKVNESDSAYVSRIQSLLPDTKTGAYQAMTIPHVDINKAKSYIQEQADDPNRKEYGIFNTCATGACDAVLPFRTKKLKNKQHTNNREGYSKDALNWALLPLTTDSYAEDAREAASDVWIMNNK